MTIYKITTKTGKTIRSRYEGTKKQAEQWASNHYIKDSYKIMRDKQFEREYKKVKKQ